MQKRFNPYIWCRINTFKPWKRSKHMCHGCANAWIILSIETFLRPNSVLKQDCWKRAGGRSGGGKSHILVFISGSLGSTEVLVKRGAVGRGFDSVTRGAKSLNVWASVKRESGEAHHHQPGASCATCQPGGPRQSGPCGRDPVFLS